MKHLPPTILLLLLAASLCMNVHLLNQNGSEMVCDTVRTTFVDTIPYHKPVPKDTLIIRYVTKTLPAVPQDKKEPAVPQGKDEPASADTARGDTAQVQVQIPITQKVYRDSSFTAYVSGFEASLDSFVLHVPHSVTTITNTSRPKQSRWSIGLQVGYGISLSPTPDYSPYIGIGVQYSLFKF